MPRALLFFLLLVSSSAFADSLSPRGDSGIDGPKYAVILDRLKALEEKYPKYARIYDYGQSLGGKTLRMIVLAKKNALVNKRQAVQITGAIHGNEYLNIADRLPETFLEQMAQRKGPIFRYINRGGVILVVPIVNPDGYDRRRRYNDNDTDLNRDWDVKASGKLGFKEPESKALSQALIDLKAQMNLDLKVTVDYHCCAGALLYPWSFTKTDLPKGDLDGHLELAKFSEGLDIDYGTCPDILAYYANGTTTDHYYEAHDAIAFTFEGRYGKEDKLFPKHVEWWEKTFNAFNEGA